MGKVGNIEFDGYSVARHLANNLALAAGGVAPVVVQSKPQGAGSMEWETPDWLIGEVLLVMGHIYLDPCSTAQANRRIGAAYYYTLEDDGLKQRWTGNVYMNPPYSRGLVEKFINKFCYAWDEMQVEQACILTNNATDTTWFHRLLTRSPMLCIFKGRISYVDPVTKLEKKGNRQGQVLWYFGRNRAGFRHQFVDYGVVCNLG